MRIVALLAVLTVCAGCGTTAGSDGQGLRDYVVIFELNAGADGKLQRLAVFQVLDRHTDRVVARLPSAAFVGEARDTLAENTWSVTYDRSGRIQPVYVRCLMAHTDPDVPVCDAPR